MLLSLQGNNNAKNITILKKTFGGTFIAKECFKGENKGHKFKEGQKVELLGLEDYPQFNGEIVTISSIRKDGPNGKAYYFKTDNEALSKQLNWLYEDRLSPVK